MLSVSFFLCDGITCLSLRSSLDKLFNLYSFLAWVTRGLTWWTWKSFQLVIFPFSSLIFNKIRYYHSAMTFAWESHVSILKNVWWSSNSEMSPALCPQTQCFSGRSTLGKHSPVGVLPATLDFGSIIYVTLRSICVSPHLAGMEERVSDERGDIHASVLRDLRDLRVKSSWSWIHVSQISVGVGVHARLEFAGASCVKIAVGMSMWIVCVSWRQDLFHAGRFSLSLDWRIAPELTLSCHSPLSRGMDFCYTTGGTMKGLTLLRWRCSTPPWDSASPLDPPMWLMSTQESPCLMGCGTLLKFPTLIRLDSYLSCFSFFMFPLLRPLFFACKNTLRL